MTGSTNTAGQSPNLGIRDGRWEWLLKHDGWRQELCDFSLSGRERGHVAALRPAVARRLSRQVPEWQIFANPGVIL
jgi:hypothetical protein